MDAVLKLGFDDVRGIRCEVCMLSFSKMGFNDETHEHCAALGSRPRCPESGCRKDCPLIRVEGDVHHEDSI